MPIKLGGYESARAKMDNLTQDEYKYIYIITVKTTVGGGGFSAAASQASASAASQFWGVDISVPMFQHEGFIPRPTLAVVGDRPGGEYVLSAERVREMAGRGGSGGGSVTIHAPFNNYAPIYGVNDLEERFSEHIQEIQQRLNIALHH
jgi:hypothetical protein